MTAAAKAAAVIFLFYLHKPAFPQCFKEHQEPSVNRLCATAETFFDPFADIRNAAAVDAPPHKAPRFVKVDMGYFGLAKKPLCKAVKYAAVMHNYNHPARIIGLGA